MMEVAKSMIERPHFNSRSLDTIFMASAKVLDVLQSCRKAISYINEAYKLEKILNTFLGSFTILSSNFVI